MLVASVWLLHDFFSDPRFRVSELVVEGTNLLRATDVKRVVNVVGSNIFRVNGRELAGRLENKFGLVEHASIRCRLPNRVFLTVREREAVLVWESGGRQWWIGRRGEVLGPTEGASDLLVIRDVKGFARQPEGHIVGVPWALALNMCKAVPAIQAFDYTTEQGLILCVTTHQWPVYLGHHGQAEAKVALMWALVGELMKQEIDVGYIDLRNDQRPIYKRL